MKSGLVLEGGAMRGLFTAGVIDVFDKEKFMTNPMEQLAFQPVLPLA